MAKREVQEINASSMADIAFLLLIFFLVTTTMSVDKGLSRRLPPLNTNQEQQDTKINERNIFIVLINSHDQLLVQGELMDVKELKGKAKEFILNQANDIHKPELVAHEVEIDGAMETFVTTKNHVISLQNDRGTTYSRYIEVQNELVAAYDEIRDDFSRSRFGMPYAELSADRQKSIQDIYPQKISEAEPKNYGGKK